MNNHRAQARESFEIAEHAAHEACDTIMRIVSTLPTSGEKLLASAIAFSYMQYKLEGLLQIYPALEPTYRLALDSYKKTGMPNDLGLTSKESN